MLKHRKNLHIHCGHCAVSHLCLPNSLGDDCINLLDQAISTVKVAKKGDYIVHAKDPMQHLYAVYSGSCKDYWIDEEGNERIDNFYFSGDIIGLESIPEQQHAFSLQALEETILCMIPMDALFKLMQEQDQVLKRVMNIASYKMKNDQQISVTTNANQRVSDFLLNILYRLLERKQCSDHIILSMSQIDISNFLGMAHETVNRILRKLHKEKIISLQNKVICITDIERLKEMASPVRNFGQIENL